MAESFEQRVRAWREQDGDAGLSAYPDRTAEELQARQVDDVERAACGLLARARPVHPLVRGWVAQILADPAYASCRPDNLRDIPLSAWRATTGLRADMGWTDDLLWKKVTGWGTAGYGAGIGHRSGDLVYPEDTSRADRATDRAVEGLAFSVAMHRLHGLPGQEQTHGLGFGLSVTTSLAAAIVEYHQDALNAAAIRRREVARDDA